MDPIRIKEAIHDLALLSVIATGAGSMKRIFSSVIDVEAEGNGMRPTMVSVAAYLIVIALIVELVLLTMAATTSFTLWQANQTSQSVSLTGGELMVLVVMAMFAILLAILQTVITFGVWRGSNRMRILYVILAVIFLVNWLVNSRGWLERLAVQPLYALAGLTALILQVVAAVLLLLPASSPWFNPMRQSKEPVEADDGYAAEPLESTKESAPKKLAARLGLSAVDGIANQDPIASTLISYVVGLLLCWLATAFATSSWAFDPLFGISLQCLPVQALVVALFGAVGAGIHTDRGLPWVGGAMRGIWVGTACAVFAGIVFGWLVPRTI